MLRIFQKIRKKLLEEGRLKRYIIYAIGEILLVVIGILIALQINNWNENRKAKKLQNELLEEVLSAINTDLIKEEKKIRENQSILRKINTVSDYLNSEKPYHDSLGNYFSEIHDYWRLTLRRDPYESLERHGTQFIKDDLIKLLLSTIYDNQYYNEDIYNEIDQYYVQIMLETLTDNFEAIPDNHSDTMKPYNFEALRNDKRYRNILKTWSYKIASLINTQKFVLDNMIKLKERLSVELNEN